MKTLSTIMSLLCLLSAGFLGGVGVRGFFVKDIAYSTALLYILLMVAGIFIVVELYIVNEESK